MSKDESRKNKEESEERAAPTETIVYQAILEEGIDELKRPSAALFWSGIAAGLSMGFSLITEGLLRVHLPETDWQPLISKFGYSIGFLIVILGRQQLFTENTLTPVLPLLQKKDVPTAINVLRMWSVVLGANLIGCFIIALAISYTPAFDLDVHAKFIQISNESMKHDVFTKLIRGIFAGWLIALTIWLLPYAESMRVLVIIIITYVVGVGQFSHIIVGSIETFVLGILGQHTWFDIFFGFFIPVLIGNIIGGVMLVAILNHAQVVAGSPGKNS